MIQHRRRQLAHAAKRIRRSATPEDFHAARVATRRLRSVLRVLEQAHDDGVHRRARELRRVGRKLGRARDLDVVLATVKALAASHGLAGSADVAAFRKDVRSNRARARRKVVRMLGGKRFRRLKRKLRELTPQRGGSAASVEARVHAHAARLSRIEIDPLAAGDDELHRYRIRTKRFRYTLELTTTHTELTRRLLDQAKRVQEQLGSLHDAFVVEALVKSFASEHRPYRESNDLAQLAAAFRVEQGRMRAELAGTLTDFRRDLALLATEGAAPAQRGPGVSSARPVPSNRRGAKAG